MSRQAEEVHERLFSAHLEECARDLVVGARVYRAGYDQIEEGQVREIDRVRFAVGDWQHEIEDPAGNYARYHASFMDGTRWESQIFQWRWFFRREDAERRLAIKLRERAKDLRRDAERWDVLAASMEAKEPT